MTDDTNQEETEAEEIEEEISLEPEESAPRRAAGSLWVVLTVIFVVLCAILVWLHTEQQGQIQGLQAQVGQATSECARVEQASRNVAGDIIELGHQAVLAAELQQSLGNHKRAEAEITLSRKFLDLAARLSAGAATSQKQAVVDKIEAVEEKLYPSTEEPETEGEVEQEEAEATTEEAEPEPAEAEIPAPE